MTNLELQYQAMCTRLRACCERHGLVYGEDYIDKSVIRALDEAKATSYSCSEEDHTAEGGMIKLLTPGKL